MSSYIEHRTNRARKVNRNGGEKTRGREKKKWDGKWRRSGQRWGTRNYCETSQWHAAQHARYHAAGVDDDVLRQRGRIFIGQTSEFGFCQFGDHGWLRGTGQWFRVQLISTIERLDGMAIDVPNTYIQKNLLRTQAQTARSFRKRERAE